MTKKIRDLTVQERAAMWLYHKEYAELGVGAIKYWEGLSQYDKNNVNRMIKEINEAQKSERKNPFQLHKWSDFVLNHRLCERCGCISKPAGGGINKIIWKPEFSNICGK